MYMYILYVRHEGAMLVILCTGIRTITTTIAGEWLHRMARQFNVP